MKYCTNCGTQLSDDAKFCSVCGTKQEVKKSPAPEQIPPKPKKPVTPPRQATTVNDRPQRPDGPKEEFFTASETAGEVVLSSWENPKPKAEASTTGTQYQQQPHQNYQQPQQPNYQQPQQPYYQQAAAPQKKKRGFFSWLIIILLILMILYFLASILEGCKNANLPPDPGTPEPQAHEGVFVSGNDTLFFNGDGKSVSWHFHSGSGSGTYTFIFGHGPCRYDVAEKLIISDTMMNKESRTFILKKPAADSLIQILGEPAADFRKLK
ncbi:MAG: zinc ribbon domain-containing protein [Spirochaetales bacterium]|nr:zinc ribbon domain-containing protein [Spirochaetales bacterium]